MSRRAGLGLATYTLWKRELVRFARQRSRVVGAALTPLVFWVLIGSGLDRSFRAAPEGAGAGVGYLEYFFPGMLVLVLLFTAIFSTISIIQDREGGFLQGVLVSPAPREAIVLGKVLGGATLATLQVALFLLVAPLAGIPLHAARLPGFLAVMFLVGAALTAFGFLLAWPMRSIMGFHAVMNLILMPMWLLSGAFFPTAGAPTWLGWAMRLNPLTYGMAAARRSFGAPVASGDLPGLGVSVAVSAAFLLVCLAAATRQVRGEGARGP